MDNQGLSDTLEPVDRPNMSSTAPDVNKRPRSGNFSKEEYAIAKTLCAEYDTAVAPEKFRTKECDKSKQKLLMDKAFAAFKSAANRQDVSRDNFKKFLSRIRCAEAAKSSSSETATTEVADPDEGENLEEEEAIREHQRKESRALANFDENIMESETTPSDDEVKNIEEDVKQMQSSAPIRIVFMKSPADKARNMDNQGLSDTLEMLHLQKITIGEWILIQRATFDIHVNGEPYHSIQIYANLKTMTFIRRVWGISESIGELNAMEDLRDLCIATFNKSMVCLGQVEPPPQAQRDLELMLVKYPFPRWISNSCSIRCAQDQDGQIIGMCSACSCGVARIKKVSNNREIEDEAIHLIIGDDLVAYEYKGEETIKFETEDTLNLYDCKECPFQAIELEGLKDHLRRNHFSCSEEKESNSELNWENDDIHESLDDTKIKPDSFGIEDIIKEDFSDYSNPKKGDAEQKQATINDNSKRRLKLKYKRRSNFSKHEKDVAKSLLSKYNALKPESCGGEKMGHQRNAAAHATWSALTERQIDRETWNKFTSRLRTMEADKLFSKPDEDTVLSYELDARANSDENAAEYNDEVNENKDNDIADYAGVNNKMEKRPRSGNFSNEERAIAKRLCAEYDSAITPEKFRTKEMNKKKQKLLMDKMWTAFKIEANPDTSRDSFTKLLSRIRVNEAQKSSSAPAILEQGHFLETNVKNLKDDFALESQFAVQFGSEQTPMEKEEMPEFDYGGENGIAAIGNSKMVNEGQDIEEKSIAMRYIKCDSRTTEESNEGKDGQHRRRPNLTKEEKELAKSLLRKYNDLKPESCGGSRLSPELRASTLQTFNSSTALQLDLDSWKKLCNRLRMEEVENLISVKCGKCPKTFSHKSNLQKHCREKHTSTKSVPNVKIPQTCDQCGLILSSMYSLKSHMKLIHSAYSEREYKCDFPGCKKSIGTASALKHHKGYHEKRFVCDHCGKAFSTKDNLSFHLKSRHKAMPTLELKCKHCDEVFSDYLRRTCHTNLVHFPDKYKCSVCQKRYGNRYLLTRHTKHAHTSGSYECQECSKTFTQDIGLKIHMRLHTGDLFNCRYCPWKGNRGEMLYRHIQKQHLMEWERDEASKSDNFRCSECGKYMMNDDHLTRHIRVRHMENIDSVFRAH